MNSSLVAISTLVKSNIGEKCLINILMNTSTQSLRDYLRLANIYKGTSTKKKTDLVGMIIYGHITKNFKKNDTQDISVKVAKIFLKDNDIVIKSWPGYSNADLKKKEVNITNNSVERSIKVGD